MGFLASLGLSILGGVTTSLLVGGGGGTAEAERYRRYLKQMDFDKRLRETSPDYASGRRARRLSRKGEQSGKTTQTETQRSWVPGDGSGR